MYLSISMYIYAYKCAFVFLIQVKFQIKKKLKIRKKYAITPDILIGSWAVVCSPVCAVNYIDNKKSVEILQIVKNNCTRIHSTNRT